MKKALFLVLWLCLFAIDAFAEECISTRKVSDNGIVGTFIIRFDVSSMAPEYPINDPFFSGTAAWDDTIKVGYPRVIVGVGIAEVTIRDWRLGRAMEFTVGVIYNNGYNGQSMENYCSPTYRIEGTGDNFLAILGAPPPPPPPPPSCSDRILNQEEEGVDCGGPCPACPPPGAKAVPAILSLLLDGK